MISDRKLVPEVLGAAWADAVLAQVQRPEARAPIQNGISAQELLRSYTLLTNIPCGHIRPDPSNSIQ